MMRPKLLLPFAMLLLTASMCASTLSFHISSPLQGSAPLCTEDAVAGCVAALPVGGTSITVASDGEATFDPFVFGADTSDGISFSAGWVADLRYPGMSVPGFWTACPNCAGPNPFTWILPAVTSCGAENEPGCEPVGAWYFPGAIWIGNIPFTFVITEQDGIHVSDTITLANSGPGGSAAVLFLSDAPEPSSVVLFGSAVLGAVGLARRRFRK